MAVTDIDITDRLVAVTCCNCHVVFGMTQTMRTALRESHRSFWCPRGHSQHFTGVSEASRLEQVLDSYTRLYRQAIADKERIERSRAALKGQITKLRRGSGATES